MKYGDMVYSLKNKEIGQYYSSTRDSGYIMAWIEYNDGDARDLEYPEQLISLEKEYSNSELWNMVERDILPKGAIIQDHEGNQMIFTGVSFQIYFTEKDITKTYIGFCKGENWRIIDVDETELDFHN
jgi:hypothetical protein